jgi:hypothetical protein
MSRHLTPLGAVARGVAAGVAGTGLMTLAQTLPAKLQSSGGETDDDRKTTEQQDPWEQASAPAKVARRFIEGVFHREVPPKQIPLLTHAMHWGYGTGWGAVYGVAQGTLRVPPLRHGLVFGTTVWAMSYVQLVPMGLYEPPWRYAPQDIAMEVGYHLAYGVGVAGAFRVLAGR